MKRGVGVPARLCREKIGLFLFSSTTAMRVYWVINDTSRTLPPEVLDVITDSMPRSSLLELVRVSKAWYYVAIPRLYRHVCISTPEHWTAFLQTMEKSGWLGKYVRSLILRPSPPLVYSQRERHYVRTTTIDTEQTGLENIHDNYGELDTTTKESAWLAYTVTSDQIRLVLSKCQLSLEYLGLAGCEQLGDEIVPVHGNMLRGLWCPLVRGLTPAGLGALATSHRHLRYLDLSFCQHLSDAVLTSALQRWPNLTHVRLCSLYELTDTTVHALVTACPNLKLLHLARCWQVTNKGLTAIADKCTELQYLSIAFLSRTNEEGIGRLVKQLPNLEWLDITSCNINAILKPMIVKSWNMERQARAWPQVHFEDRAVALLS